MKEELLLWSSYLKIDSFCTSLEDFYPSINFNLEKAEIALTQ